MPWRLVAFFLVPTSPGNMEMYRSHVAHTRTEHACKALTTLPPLPEVVDIERRYGVATLKCVSESLWVVARGRIQFTKR